MFSNYNEGHCCEAPATSRHHSFKYTSGPYNLVKTTALVASSAAAAAAAARASIKRSAVSQDFWIVANHLSYDTATLNSNEPTSGERRREESRACEEHLIGGVD